MILNKYNNTINILDLPMEILQYIIICSGSIGIYMIHFVSNVLSKMTENNQYNYKLGISFTICYIEYPWMKNPHEICTKAKNYGFLEIQKWAHENGCPMPQCKNTAHKHLKNFKSAFKNGYKISTSNNNIYSGYMCCTYNTHIGSINLR